MEDAEELHQLMYDAFTPLRELGIDWPSVNADLEMVKNNLENNTTFVMVKGNEIISTITVRYPWGSVRSISGYPFIYGGLRLNHLMMVRAMVVNCCVMLKRIFKRYIKSGSCNFRYLCKTPSLVT